jgi:DNA-binding HxlR family transcriptional regulator
MSAASVAAEPTTLSAGGTNAVGRILGLLGDEWTLLIIQQALLGATRYGEFMERLPISNSVLTKRLRALTDNGLLVRTIYRTRPVRAEYLITQRVDLGVGTTMGAQPCPPTSGNAPHHLRQRLRTDVDLPIMR